VIKCHAKERMGIYIPPRVRLYSVIVVKSHAVCTQLAKPGFLIYYVQPVSQKQKRKNSQKNTATFVVPTGLVSGIPGKECIYVALVI